MNTQTQAQPTKQATKIIHVADGDAVEEARITGITQVPSICGMKLLPLRPRYHMVNRDTAEELAPSSKRPCKRCLKVLDKWQRAEDKRIIKRMERQFSGGGHE